MRRSWLHERWHRRSAKLEWAKQGASERQINDVVGILRVRGESIDRAYIAHWIGALGLEKQWESALAHEVRSR